ncbi:sulfite exporter TauE/SafE family protein [Agrobacterium sp. 22-214-1]
MSNNGKTAAFAGGALVGTLGGLIGLGGAEFRLPLLIGVYGFGALSAVIMNKAMSLIVVAFSLPFRGSSVPFEDVAASWPILVNILAGSLLGAWFGADWATKLKSKTLFRTISVLLVVIAVVLLFGHGLHGQEAPPLAGPTQIVAGVAAGFAIGVVAALMGVAGGELLIPTLILLFGVDIKLAGSLSLAISLPTMLVGFARYSRDGSFSVINEKAGFAVAMAAGSIIGAFVGSLLLGLVDAEILLLVLSLILVVSAFKVWRHE